MYKEEERAIKPISFGGKKRRFLHVWLAALGRKVTPTEDMRSPGTHMCALKKFHAERILRVQLALLRLADGTFDT